MKHFYGKGKESVLNILAGGIIPLAYLSWCFSTIAYKSSIFMPVSAGVGILAAILYCSLEKHMLDHKRYEDEILVLDICIFIVGIAFEVAVFKTYEINGKILILIALIFWFIAATYGVKKYTIPNKKGEKAKHAVAKVYVISFLPGVMILTMP